LIRPEPRDDWAGQRPPRAPPFTERDDQIGRHAIGVARDTDVGQREWLDQPGVIEPRQAATKLGDVEHIALVERHGTAQGRIVDRVMPREVDAADDIRGSHSQVRREVE
jgi:hypothetical protein